MDRYVARPGGPKGPQAQKTETVAHNSVFAGHREAGDQQRTPFDPAAAGLKKFRGYSSVGRAVALQAIGQGFESPYLQTLFPGHWTMIAGVWQARAAEEAKGNCGHRTLGL
jgi:hypothetical protein